MTEDLVARYFLPALGNPYLDRLDDQAVLDIGGARLAFTTDSYVVSPLFFPGGDIGALAVNGTVNDIAMAGARPAYLSAGFILEEGFPLADLRRIVASMLVVLALAGYLIAIAWALLDTRRSVVAIADGLEAVRGHTAPLPEKLATINGALGALLGGLEAADRHLGRAATVFRLH